MGLDRKNAPDKAPEPDVEAPEVVEASEVEAPAEPASEHGAWYQILSDRLVYGAQGSVVHLDLDNDTSLHLIGSGHLARVESGPKPE